MGAVVVGAGRDSFILANPYPAPLIRLVTTVNRIASRLGGRSVSDPSLAHACQSGCEPAGTVLDDSTLGPHALAMNVITKIRNRENDQRNRNSAAARTIYR
jgi:hypothetical protein